MAKKKTWTKLTDEQIKERRDQVKQMEETTNELICSDVNELKRFLDFSSYFTKYSYNNQLLILSQLPTATKVMRLKAWNKFERNIKKGEHGLWIWSPTQKKREKYELDDNGNKILLPDGTYKKIEETYTGFTVNTVFDISQTEGSPLPDTEIFGEDPLFETEEDLYDALSAKYNIKKNTAANMLYQALNEQLTDNVVNRDMIISGAVFICASNFNMEIDVNLDALSDWTRGKTLKEIKAIMEPMRKIAGDLIQKVA